MKFIDEEVLFESTGRREYCNGDRGFSPNEPGGVTYGSDGGFGGLKPEEIKELAIYMIAQWLKWANGFDIYRDTSPVEQLPLSGLPAPRKAINAEDVTVGNAAWVMLEGGVVPQAVWDQMADDHHAMLARTETNKICEHEWSRELDEKVKTKACVKCGAVRLIADEDPPPWWGSSRYIPDAERQKILYGDGPTEEQWQRAREALADLDQRRAEIEHDLDAQKILRELRAIARDGT